MTTPALETNSGSRQGKGRKLSGGGASGRAGQAVASANRWRETYNAARGLTMRRVIELLEEGQRGDTAYLQWTFATVERRYSTLSGLVSRCEAPLTNFDWTVKIKETLPETGNGKDGKDGSDGKAANPYEEMAERQQATLREAYEGIDNLREAIKHLHLAEFRGYSHLQKHRRGDGSVYHLEPLNQWCVCRDGLEGDWFWNPEARAGASVASLGEACRIGGTSLPAEDFIVQVCARPIDEIGLRNFVRSSLCDKNWDGFVEIYGIPGGVVTMPPNVPQGKESEYETAARQVAEGGSGAIPNGASYAANDSPRGTDPFSPRLKRLDEEVVLVGTGGKLTMLTESGSGTLAGGAHEDSFVEIAAARSKIISERFQRDFDLEVLARKHPGEPVLAYFVFGVPDQDSKETTGFKREVIKALAGHELLSRVIANQSDLKEMVRDSGLPVNEEYVDPYVPVTEANGAEVTGEVVRDAEGDVVGGKAEGGTSNIQHPTSNIERETLKGDEEAKGAGANGIEQMANGKGEEADAEAQSDAEKIANREGGARDVALLEESGKRLVVEALQSEFEALNARLEGIAEISDPETQKAKLAAVLADLDKFEADLAKDPAVASAIYKVLAAGLGNGMADGGKS